jgi:CheY-like chemotaxis protein
VRDLATDILHHHGYRLLVAPDGATAMDLFESRREEIALVLLDVSMPRMSGIETLEAILSLDPEAKVVLSSGYILDGLGFGEVPAGAKAFVHKPFRPDDLARTIREVLDS